MIAVFDGACLGDGPITGVGRAFLNGLAAYAEGAAASTTILLLLPEGAQDPSLARVDCRVAPRGAWQRQRHLPRLLRALRATVFHSPVAAVPLRAPCPTIATVHDLPWLHAESEERTPLWRRLATRMSLRCASAVIAPTTFTLTDARRYVGKHTRLLLVPHGTLPPESTVDPAARTGPVLVLGDDRPRKNRALVRVACSMARAQDPSLPELCFAGPPGNYVDEREKEQLLRGCRLLVQASRFEGFGMPVLEGLAHGIPVVCSDLPPHREIAGDAAIYVDPLSVSSVAQGILRAHQDQALRSRLAQLGPLRANALTPSAVAAAWRQLHEELTR